MIKRLTNGYGLGDVEVDSKPSSSLSAREAQALAGALNGLTHSEIGELMGISARSVTNKMQSIYYKLHCNNIPAAMAKGIKQGIVRICCISLVLVSCGIDNDIQQYRSASLRINSRRRESIVA